ncbi:hypothetical protein LJC09_02815 [Desulfovibrio sp. OttesenSCG-928-F20]|nr:hypothetical protein [Desulfovibrio sp. OttesenSCG-928-M16]MDL2291014.1 hypothetical protein [Desulfovibrio sp. OttesenSCG-928-F20]
MAHFSLPRIVVSIAHLFFAHNKARGLFSYVACLTLACCILVLGACSEQAPSPEERYWRAVHVLRSFGGPAAAEEENIASRIIYSDETESLLHHRDTIFVLGRIADDLALSGTVNPKAPLYEAYARLALGQRQKAVALLMAYVVEKPYRCEHYALLCENLHALEDYASLLLICYEWRERDKACRDERSRLSFAALFNLGRFEEALHYIRGQAECLGWRAAVYEARTQSALGNTEGANDLVREAMRSHPAEASQIRRFWDILRVKDKI